MTHAETKNHIGKAERRKTRRTGLEEEIELENNMNNTRATSESTANVQLGMHVSTFYVIR